MCRSIKKLRRPDAAPTDQELHEAALQFVRKISGFHAPSQANTDAFDAAVRDVARAGRTFFTSLRARESARVRPASDPGIPGRSARRAAV